MKWLGEMCADKSTPSSVPDGLGLGQNDRIYFYGPYNAQNTRIL